MKKTLTVGISAMLVAALGCFGLVGCAGGDKPSDTTSNAGSTAISNMNTEATNTTEGNATNTMSGSEIAEGDFPEIIPTTADTSEFCGTWTEEENGTWVIEGTDATFTDLDGVVTEYTITDVLGPNFTLMKNEPVDEEDAEPVVYEWALDVEGNLMLTGPLPKNTMVVYAPAE